MMMRVAHELHMSEEEVAQWSLERILRWMAYFAVDAEDQKRRANKSRRNSLRTRARHN